MNTAEQYRRPESVLIVVYAYTGDALLLRRCKPWSFWQSVTGSLERGESHAAAAARELAEETGIVADERLVYTGRQREFEIDPRWRHRYAPGVTHNMEYEWHFCVDQPLEICLDYEEHSAYCWMPVAEAVNAVWSWTNTAALDELRRDLFPS